jgi:hypothetical protein
MKDSSSVDANGRVRLIIVGAALLLCAGVVWFSITLWRDQRPEGQGALSEAGTIATASLLAQPDNNASTDGKPGPIPTPGLPAGLSNVPPAIDQRPIPERARRDFEQLFAVVSPIHDYFDAAEELGGLELGQRTLLAAASQVGGRRPAPGGTGLRR